jgi:uncharacterized OB-fold protein
MNSTETSDAAPDNTGPEWPEQRWWAAAAAGELIFQWCERCDQPQHPPRPVCAHGHQAGGLVWRSPDGRGAVHSATEVWTTPVAGFQDRVPYWIGIAELPPGIFLIANLPDGTTAEQAEHGAPVQVRLLPSGDQVLPVLVPRDPAAAATEASG